MTTEQALRILDAHSIQWIRTSTGIMVMDVYTKNGHTFTGLVDCPSNYHDLMVWLGY